MRCPKCQHRVAPFLEWFFWPGPNRTCRHCGARLRYQNFYWALGLHAVLGAGWILLNLPLWVLAVIVLVTAVVYPWFLGRYELIA